LLTDQQRENRKRFIRDLRDNPYQFVQNYDGMMIDKNGRRCALGLACGTFQIWISPGDLDGMNLAYSDVNSFMGSNTIPELPRDSDYYGAEWTEIIWTLNDAKKLTFSGIADKLEEKGFLNE
jgi:hypothetical protein